MACCALLISAGGCAIQADPADFLVDPSGIEALLTSACADGEVADPLHVVVSDYSGYTYVAEPESDRMWVRNPFGLVPDHCYWVSTEPDRVEWPEEDRPACFENGLAQDGSCTGEESRPDDGGWTFVHGGWIDVGGLRGRVAVDGELAVAWSGDEHPVLRVIDLRPGSTDCPSSQHPWYFHRVLYSPVLTAGHTGFADGDLALDDQHLVSLSPDDKALAVWTLPLPCNDEDAMPAPVRVELPCKPDGPLALDPAGDRAFAVCASAASVLTVTGLSTDAPAVDRRQLSGMRAPAAIAYDALTDHVWVAAPAASGGRVKAFPADGGAATAFDVPGASHLVVGQTASGGTTRSRVYALGSGHDGVYRLDVETGTAEVASLGSPARALGIGGDQQEIAVVLEGEGGEPVLRSFLDADHLAAQQTASVHLSAAAFLEFPRDPALDDESGLRGEIQAEPDTCADIDEVTQDWPQLDRTMYQVCCLQAARADHVAENLDYLEYALVDRIPGEADGELLLGINGTVLLQSAHCIQAGLELGRDELIEFGLPLLEVYSDRVGALVQRGDVVPVLLVHTSAGTEDQVPYTCPDLWRPDLEDPDCDVEVVDQTGYVAFLDDLLDTASLRDVAASWQGTGGCGNSALPLLGECVYPADFGVAMQGLSGGYDRAIGIHANYPDVRWPPALATAFPGVRQPFAYFGGGGNYSGVANAISKELAPWDTRLRASPFGVGDDPVDWDVPADDGPLRYIPGVTVSHSYLYEWARSGLFVMDGVWHASGTDANWADERFEGDESSITMGPADFAVLTHYLVYHVLAAREADRERTLYFHLPDIGGISLETYGGGRVVCTEDGQCDTRDAMQDWISDTLPQLGTALTWGLPEEFR